MNLISVASALPQFLRTFEIDDGTVALLALLAGMLAGYCLTTWHGQLKARRAKIDRKPPSLRRESD